MTKIIEDPSRLINAFAASFGEHNRYVIEQAFSQYISDAVIAITAEDIASQAIAWANFREDFPCDLIDIDADAERFTSIQNTLIQMLDIESIIKAIDKDWDKTSSTCGDAIEEALFSLYTALSVLTMVINADTRYSGGVNE